MDSRPSPIPTPGKAELLQGPRGFLLRRARRLSVLALIGGLVTAVIASQHFAADFAQATRSLQTQFDSRALAELPALLLWLYGPLVLAIAITTVTGVLLTTLAGALIYALLPPVLLVASDGIAFVLLISVVAEATGFTAWMSTQGIPSGAMFPIILIFWFSLSPGIWARLPFGLTLTDEASTTLATRAGPLAEALLTVHDTPRLAPGAAARVSTAIGSHQIVTRPTPHQLVVTSDNTDPATPPETQRFTLHPGQDGRCTLTLEITLKNLSPLVWWDFWSRPFARDMLAQTLAELSGAPDRSINGRALRRHIRSLEKRTPNAA